VAQGVGLEFKPSTEKKKCSGGSSQSTKQEKESKRIHTGRKEVNLPLFTDVMILSAEHPMASTKAYFNFRVNLARFHHIRSIAKYQLHFCKQATRS
jgi:hypothetical protein